MKDKEKYRPQPVGKILCHYESGSILLPSVHICLDPYSVPSIRETMNMDPIWWDDSMDFSYLYIEQAEGARTYVAVPAANLPIPDWKGTGFALVYIESKNERIDRLSREVDSKAKTIAAMSPFFVHGVEEALISDKLPQDLKQRLEDALKQRLSKVAIQPSIGRKEVVQRPDRGAILPT